MATALGIAITAEVVDAQGITSIEEWTLTPAEDADASCTLDVRMPDGKGVANAILNLDDLRQALTMVEYERGRLSGDEVMR